MKLIKLIENAFMENESSLENENRSGQVKNERKQKIRGRELMIKIGIFEEQP